MKPRSYAISFAVVIAFLSLLIFSVISILHGPIIEVCEQRTTIADLQKRNVKFIILDLSRDTKIEDGVIRLRLDEWDRGFESLMDVYTPGLSAALRCDPGCNAYYTAYQRLRREIPGMQVWIIAEK